MKKLNMLCLAIMAITIGCLGLTNYKQGKRINYLEGDMYLTNMQLNNTSMKLEMFLEMIEEEMHSSIKRISRPIAREEVIKELVDYVKVEIKYHNSEIKIIETICRIDTKNEMEYYRNGGILQYVLRNML